MKKVLSIIAVMIMVTTGYYSTATAGMIGNPTATVENGKITAGLDVDITSRDMEDSDGFELEADSNRILLNATYGINPLNVYLKLGMANGEVKSDDATFDGDYGFAYGVGGKATVYEIANTAKIGVGAQLLKFTTEDTIEDVKVEADQLEYDIFAGASYLGLGEFIPYGGILISIVDGEISAEGESLDYEQADNFGIFLGGDYKFTNKLTGGIEARFVNETSFSFNLSYPFSL